MPLLNTLTKTGRENMFSLKTFKDSYDSAKNFYHVKVFGIKFRVATRTRGMKSNYTTYKTGRGRVITLGRKYICIMGG
tara:strand:+ start:188 stop:421 length:234 start_codon:yes stop_codon:yes gene_type:complete